MEPLAFIGLDFDDVASRQAFDDRGAAPYQSGARSYSTGWRMMVFHLAGVALRMSLK
jgi:hypothetical protein